MNLTIDSSVLNPLSTFVNSYDTASLNLDIILANNDLILTVQSVSTIVATSGNDSLTGTSATELIQGLAGNDTLIGGKGNDILTGGNGADDFRFNDDIHGIDAITDFNVTEDRILVSAGKFGGGLIKNATITESQFTLGNSATTSEQRFIYDSGSGALWFDIDGNGDNPLIQIVQLSNTPENFSKNNIVVI